MAKEEMIEMEGVVNEVAEHDLSCDAHDRSRDYGIRLRQGPQASHPHSRGRSCDAGDVSLRPHAGPHLFPPQGRERPAVPRARSYRPR